MKVGELTRTQADTLTGEMVAPDWYFNPVMMADGALVISTEEMYASEFEEFAWVRDLPLIDWVGPFVPLTGDTPNYFSQFFSGNTN